MFAEPLLATLLVGVAALLLRVSRSSFGQLTGAAGVVAGVYLLGQAYLPAEVGEGRGAAPGLAADGGWTALAGVALGLGLLASAGFRWSGRGWHAPGSTATADSPDTPVRSGSRRAPAQSRSSLPPDPPRRAGD